MSFPELNEKMLRAIQMMQYGNLSPFVAEVPMLADLPKDLTDRIISSLKRWVRSSSDEVVVQEGSADYLLLDNVFLLLTAYSSLLTTHYSLRAANY